jgi:gas vesicle protein
MEQKKTFGIHFSCLAPTIGKQLKDQKLNFSKEKVKDFEKSRNAIVQLMFDNILNDAQTSKAYTKLFTKIKQHVKAKNKDVSVL